MPMSTDELNAVLLASVKDRGPRGSYGIRSAADYVGGFLDCMFKTANCPLPTGFNGIETLKAAEQRLTYCNEETVCQGELHTSSASIAEFCKQAGVEAPAKTLMVFENIITTPIKDRDGDILRTEGAKIDKAMPLLWHHMLPMPVGKMLKVIEHNAKRLKVLTAVIDSSLGRDVAEFIEFGALRISHGFLPTQMERLPSKGDEAIGWDIKQFEIMEESVVTVPSNTDAVITLFSQGKLTDPVAKTWAQRFFDERAKVFPVGIVEVQETNDTREIAEKKANPEPNFVLWDSQAKEAILSNQPEDALRAVDIIGDRIIVDGDEATVKLMLSTVIDKNVHRAAIDRTVSVEHKSNETIVPGEDTAAPKDDTEKPKAQPLTVEEYGRLFVCGMFLSPGGETEKHVDEMLKVCHVWKAKRKKAKRREAVSRVLKPFRR